MKKIINGKKYDTKTATLVSSSVIEQKYFGDFSDYTRYESGQHRNLYRKNSGEYFVHVFSKNVDDMTIHECIIPYPLFDAKEFVERYDNDKYEEIFGEVTE